MQQDNINLILQTLGANFNTHPIMLLPVVLVIIMVIFRIPALPALLGNAMLGGIFALLFQDADLGIVLGAAQNGYVAETGVASVDALLSRGGLESMMSTVALIICALSFGGVMERTGMLNVIGEAVLRRAKSSGSLVMSTIITAIGMNIIAPDQYLSIVVPGRMYREAYKKAKLKPKNLSRALEDGGTLSSCLIPWNTGGAYMWATLGVYPFAYLPFAFLNLINPIISIILGYTGLTMEKEEEENLPKNSEASEE